MPDITFDIRSRQAAFELGYQWFFTGEPCKRGHLSRRYVSNGACEACQNHTYKRMHLPNTDLVNFMPSKLRCTKKMDRIAQIRLRHYLQTCIYAYIERNHADHVTKDVAFSINAHNTTVPNVHAIGEVP